MIHNPPKFDFFNSMVVMIDLFFSFIFHPANNMHIKRKRTRCKIKKRSYKWKPIAHIEPDQHVINDKVSPHYPG